MRTEVLSGIERRRRWSGDERAQIIGETLLPGANISAVARRYGISNSLLFSWRRHARRDVEVSPSLVPVMIAAPEAIEAPSTVIAPSAPIIELDFESGARLRIFDAATPDIRYALNHWEGLTRFLDDGRLELDTNPVENSIRPIALTRKNVLFAGHEVGAENWALLASIIGTCKLNDVNPVAYLETTLVAIINGHPKSKIDDLMPWRFQKMSSRSQ